MADQGQTHCYRLYVRASVDNRCLEWKSTADYKGIERDADTGAARHPGRDHQRIRPDFGCGARAVLSEPRGSPHQSAAQVVGPAKGRKRTHRGEPNPVLSQISRSACVQEGREIHRKSLRDLPVNRPSTCSLEEREADREEQLDQASDGHSSAQWRAFFDAHRLRSI